MSGKPSKMLNGPPRGVYLDWACRSRWLILGQQSGFEISRGLPEGRTRPYALRGGDYDPVRSYN